MSPFWLGVIAGYGIAVPVGAISLLIIQKGIRCGFPCAAGAGAGAATADLLYSLLAVTGGATVASFVAQYERPFRIASATVLLVIAITGLRLRMETKDLQLRFDKPVRSYFQFLGLTVVNPMTVVYFAAFVIGMGITAGITGGQRIAFVMGAFLASLSWQLTIAGVGALVGPRMTDGIRKWSMICGNILVAIMAVVILIR